jgi:2-methylisocitrate lyase-like PEP mutase family enzyme
MGLFEQLEGQKMNRQHQVEKANAFRRMHEGSRILVLPNAWDVASARVFEEAGFPAVATTSAGVAATLGYPDGELVGRDAMAEVVARIARAVSVPVTADMEAGYDSVARTVQAVVEAGAIGMNLEDSTAEGTLLDESVYVERLRAAREAATHAGVPIVINARTDVFLLGIGDESSRLDHAIRRANAYRSAGADCAFIPGVRDAKTIASLVKGVSGPINVLAVPGSPPIAELERLGVARVSIGSGAMRATMTLTRKIAEELRGPGTYELFTRDVITHAQVNQLMARAE